MRQKHSDYMHWAKTQSRARYNLATSGVGPFPLRELPYDPAQLEINGNNSYGYAPLQRAIAEHVGAVPECVVTAAGTSFANYLAMATVLDPGDEVLMERPAYGLLLDAAAYVGAQIKRFDRTEESGYALDAGAILRAVSPKTRLIVITNLHNPSGVLTPDEVLREVIDIARSVGAYVLMDEVYLDAVYEDTPCTSFQFGHGNVIVTSSLTKVYGLSGLRCGWILARPDLAEAMWRLNDLFAATPVHPGELLSVVAFQHLEAIRDRARRVVEADRKSLNEFLDREKSVSAVRTGFGTTCFLNLHRGDAQPFLDRLRAGYETSAVPGRFFEMPGHIRIGMGVDHEMFVEGLRRLGLALSGAGL